MKQTREVLRLYLLADLSSRKIQGATGVARTTVQDYIKRCKQSDITAQSLDVLNNDQLRVKLFAEQTSITVKSGKVMPDYTIIHQELKQSKEDKTKVTLRDHCTVTHKKNPAKPTYRGLKPIFSYNTYNKRDNFSSNRLHNGIQNTQ